MDNKILTVTAGPRSNPVTTNVQLNGVLPEERLTPQMARRAARVAFGHSNQVTVWDGPQGRGYRLYKQSARKLRVDPPD